MAGAGTVLQAAEWLVPVRRKLPSLQLNKYVLIQTGMVGVGMVLQAAELPQLQTHRQHKQSVLIQTVTDGAGMDL